MATETITSPVPVPGDAFERNFHFPPFPPVPDGVQILPFIDFREWGTRVVGADKIERDGLGIATIPLPPKSNKKKGKKKSAAGEPGPRTEWWEDWAASGEDLRIRGPYDPNLDRVDRLHQAATDFHQYYQIHIGLHGLWDHLRNFIGVSSSTVFKTSTPAYEDDDMLDDDDSDVEIDPAFEMQGASDAASPTQGGEPAPPVEDSVNAHTKEESKAKIFMTDPVRGIQLFLSSYMRAQGLVWDARKLVAAPHLVRFFVQYLIRNAVLPEHTEALARTLDVIDVAGIQLPRIPVIPNALPDAFSVACEECWGRKADGLMLDDDVDSRRSNDDEPEAKRPRLDLGAEVAEAAPADVSPQTLTQVGMAHGADKAPGIKSTDAGSTPDEKDAENADTAAMDTDAPGDWVSGGWSAGDWDAPPSVFSPPAPGAPATLLPPLPTLMALLGPTTLPLTHTPGAVERSTRRIASIASPTAEMGISTIGDNSDADADTVERGLAARMHRVVLVPWLDWDLDPEVSAPCLLRSSAPGAAHDPCADAITLLVEPAAAETLCIGMGLGGTWVQLARVADIENVQAEKEKGEKGEYWYLEELVMIMPSFWVV